MNSTTKNTAHIWTSNYLFQFYLFFGVFFPFYPLWLKNFDVDSKDIGIIIASGLICRCLASIGIGAMTKNQSHYLPVLRLLSIFSLCSALLMYYFKSNFLSLLTISCLLNIVIAPIFGTTESLVSFLDKRKVLDYGSTRLWGSIGFFSATMMCGYIFDIYSLSILPFLLALIGIGMVVSSFINCSALNTQLNQSVSKQTAINDKTKSSNAPIYLFFSIVVLIIGSHAFLFGFSSVYWAHLDLSKAAIGYAWSISVTGEVFIFVLARRIFARASVITLLVLSSLTTILRWTGLAYAETAVFICLIQILHGGTFALTQLAMVKGMQLFISDAKLATFQGLIQGLIIAVIASLTYLCGLYYDEYLGILFLFMALIGVICLFLCACFHYLFGSYKSQSAD